ncbi:hypothetical protein NIIDNTM18_54280 [Mycolicibacterium litorale]|uniref:Uncharacterized protein n=1 Tax=Mycolicibacterium litorale TaxID=758802 RepID=A0A6S6PI52_9MYCO|nr:hypothetical protein NIIDNTM18_54280 [Mycolicibacterium litorale]
MAISEPTLEQDGRGIAELLWTEGTGSLAVLAHGSAGSVDDALRTR